jgi:hypothetical protein
MHGRSWKATRRGYFKITSNPGWTRLSGGDSSSPKPQPSQCRSGDLRPGFWANLARPVDIDGARMSHTQERVNRRIDLHQSAAGLRTVVRCSQVPRWGQTKEMYYYYHTQDGYLAWMGVRLVVRAARGPVWRAETHPLWSRSEDLPQPPKKDPFELN